MHFLTSFTKFHAMPDIPRHPNKDIAQRSHTLCRGDGVLKRPSHGHIFGDVHFAQNESSRTYFYIHSTPRNPTIHARKFRRYIDVCAHTLRR